MNPDQAKHVIGIVFGAVLLTAAPIVARVLYVAGMQRASDTLGSGPGIRDRRVRPVISMQSFTPALAASAALSLALSS